MVEPARAIPPRAARRSEWHLIHDHRDMCRAARAAILAARDDAFALAQALAAQSAVLAARSAALHDQARALQRTTAATLIRSATRALAWEGASWRPARPAGSRSGPTSTAVSVPRATSRQPSHAAVRAQVAQCLAVSKVTAAQARATLTASRAWVQAVHQWQQSHPGPRFEDRPHVS